MGLIKKLKSLFGGRKQRRKAGMPRRYQTETWNQGARRMLVGGDRNKKLIRVENGEPDHWYPYNKHIAEAMEQVMSIPLWPETGGESKPTDDYLASYDPGLTGYDQTRLRRK